jgi:flagellar hook-associated protein 1 FlgK
MSLLNVGARALLANQVALQTAGNNISNANTEGYSRQTVDLETVVGQYTGSGYIGNGVAVATIVRNYNELLTRQAASAQAQQSADNTRYQNLSQMQDIFSTGDDGLGASVSDMMNSLLSVVSSPTDQSARTATLAGMDEMTARMRSAGTQLQDMQTNVASQLKTDAAQINSLAQNIATVNGQIARAQGTGQPPNDLLDQRDEYIRQLNQYIQTTQVPASDGTVTVFVAGSQALVMGTSAASVSVDSAQTFPGSGQVSLFFNRANSNPVELNTSMLGGGEVAGLLNFANNDLTEASNLLGRIALAVGTTLNQQQNVGLTLDGSYGTDLFSVNLDSAGRTSSANASARSGTVSLTDATSLKASDYEVRFDGTGGGTVIRLSDGAATAFTDINGGTATSLNSMQIDGLSFNFDTATTTPQAGDRVLFQPYDIAAANIQALVYSPDNLAVANPVNAAMGQSNDGTLQLAGLQALPGTATPITIPAANGTSNVQLLFHSDGTYDVNLLDTTATPPAATPTGVTGTYLPGQPITYNGISITLQGTPDEGDTVTIGNALDPQYGSMYTRDGGNATALFNLSDAQIFDGAALTDGYASLVAQVGTRTQSAQYAANVSETIASNLESDRTSVSGVNLDEEATKLIQYQQSYQASAKLLQTAQTIFNSLLSAVGAA